MHLQQIEYGAIKVWWTHSPWCWCQVDIEDGQKLDLDGSFRWSKNPDKDDLMIAKGRRQPSRKEDEVKP